MDLDDPRIQTVPIGGSNARDGGHPATMTAAQLEQHEATEEEVVVWRVEQLLEAGYEPSSARVLARRRDVDLHQAVELIGRGCPPALAFSILR
jgi:hypothetical protein